MTEPNTSGPDLETFRREAEAWFAENAAGVSAPVDLAMTTPAQVARNREFYRALGERGWYSPGWPSEYGGGGLPPAYARVIEGLGRSLPNAENLSPSGDIGESVSHALWALGTEEQKRRFLPPILRGEVVTWELFTEPEAGSDLPSLKTRAVRNGDSYTLKGTKTLVGGIYQADQYFVLANTDPDGKRHQNLSVFMVPADAPGITVAPFDMLGGSPKHTIFLDDVVIPEDNIIGKEGDGWPAFAGTRSMARDFGPVGLSDRNALRGLTMLDRLMNHSRTVTRGGKRLIDRPEEQLAIGRIWMDGEVQRLLRRRAEEPGASHPAYLGGQLVLGRKLFDLRLAEAIQTILGPSASLVDPSWAPEDGHFEFFQRWATLQAHPGGTCEVQKIRMFRGMVAERAGVSEGTD